MQRETAAAKTRWIGALGLVLTLPFSFLTHAATPSGEPYQSASAVSADRSVPQRWRNYALASISPKFSWAPTLAAVALPSVTDEQVTSASIVLLIDSIGSQPNSFINVSIAQSVIADRPQALARASLNAGFEQPGFGLQRTIVAPSYVSKWGDSGTVGVTAVLAYQRFASLGMGSVALDDNAVIWPLVPGETSYGAGMRLEVGDLLSNRLSWNAALQSRVDMDALNSLRGVYSDPGQFDIPASASVGVNFELTSALSFDVGVERVMYNDVTPFTSPVLPRRFLSLLGSGASPEFAWENLNVYSAGWTLSDNAWGDLELRFTTRQQPVPTSELLRTALDADPADYTAAVGYSRSTGRRAILSLQAVYSSAPYFLGVPSYRASNNLTGNQVEYMAAWSLQF